MNDHAYIEQEQQTCLVKSCSECCMSKINGEINIKGLLHRMEYSVTTPQRTLADGYVIKETTRLNCRICPVHLNSVKSGEFDRVLREIDNQE